MRPASAPDFTNPQAKGFASCNPVWIQQALNSVITICEMCSLNINGWEMMISFGFLAATG